MMIKQKPPVLVLLVIAISALILRAYMLEERPFHFDEAIEGLISFDLYKTGVYTYSPSTHGPSLYYLTYIPFYVIGDSDSSARIVPVIFGMLLLPLIYLLKKEIGPGYLASMIFVAVSPTLVYYSRFYRHDMAYQVFLLSAITFLWLFSTHGKKTFLVLGAFSLGMLMSTKEESLIALVTIVIPFALLISLSKNIYKVKLADLPYITPVIVTPLLLYSSFTQNIPGIYTFADTSFLHWFSVQGQDSFLKEQGYYINILTQYELPILILGTIGLVCPVYKKNKFMLFMSYWMVVNLAVFSYYSYKAPWLSLHILIPLVILSGYGISTLAQEIETWHQAYEYKPLLTVIVLIASTALLMNTVNLNFVNYAVPTHYNNSNGTVIQKGELLIEGGQPREALKCISTFLPEYTEMYKDMSRQLVLYNEPVQFKWYFRNYKYANSTSGFLEDKIMVTDPLTGRILIKENQYLKEDHTAVYLDNGVIISDIKWNLTRCMPLLNYTTDPAVQTWIPTFSPKESPPI